MPHSQFPSTMSSEPIACTLTSEELQQEAANLLPGLIATAQNVEWLPEGIRLIFSAETSLLQRIVSVIERERSCCRFFHFKLDIAPGGGLIDLEVTGPPGTRAVLEVLPAPS